MKTMITKAKQFTAATTLLLLVVTGCASTRNYPTAWDYKVVAAKGIEAFEQAINTATADGWEFVSTSTYGDATPLAVMRRPKK